MKANRTFEFPEGVDTGNPFTSPEDAVVWLNTIILAGSAPVDFGCRDAHKRLGPWTLSPIVTVEAPRQIFHIGDEVWTDSPAWEYAVSTGRAEPITGELVAAVASNAAVGGPVNPPMVDFTGQLTGFALRPGVYLPGYMPAVVAVGQVRILAGWEALARKRFNAARAASVGVRGAAWSLGQHETALAMARDEFLAVVNRWVATVWADCVNGGLDVWPNPENSNPRHKPASINPAGTVRVGL
jgi:hypothetical protein